MVLFQDKTEFQRWLEVFIESRRTTEELLRHGEEEVKKQILS